MGWPNDGRWPKVGAKVRFLGENGHDYELKEAKKVFNTKAIYTISDVRIGDWSSTYGFVGIPGVWNTVMFEEVKMSEHDVVEQAIHEHNDGGYSNDPSFKSVLQDWVMRLPLREQGTLLTGVRSCDLSPKFPPAILERYGCSTGEATPDRQLVAFLRYCFMNPADPREVDVPGAFFQSKPPCDWKPSSFGHYPQHWYSHLMHCFEVIAYRHPSGRGIVLESYQPAPHKPVDNIAWLALGIYHRLVHNMHLNPETREGFIRRMSEDRIANGTVVS